MKILEEGSASGGAIISGVALGYGAMKGDGAALRSGFPGRAICLPGPAVKKTRSP
jgi:hypothetical protein